MIEFISEGGSKPKPFDGASNISSSFIATFHVEPDAARACRLASSQG